MKDSAFLRLSDRWIGAPLCFLVSWLFFFRFGRAGADARPIRKILIVELFEMGAAVMGAPSIAYLKREISGVEIHCLTSQSSKAVWLSLGDIPEERIHTIKDRSGVGFAFSAFAVAWRLRQLNFDVVIDFALFYRVAALLSWFLKARHRAGFYRYSMEGLSRGRIYDRICLYNQNEHVAKNFLALTKSAIRPSTNSLGLKEAVKREEIRLPEYRSDAKAKESLLSKLAVRSRDYEKYRLVVVSPDVGPVLAVRTYPKEYFVEAIERLIKTHPDVLVCLVGTPADRVTTQSILQRVESDRCVDLSGETTFNELLELLSMAVLVVSNDNGIAHFAGITDTPSIALFSAETPFMYGPLGPTTTLYSFYHCSPCVTVFNHKHTSCSDNKCLQAIPPKRLTDFIELGLSGQLKPRTINNEVPYLL